MALLDHVQILDEGVDVWNKWRISQPEIRPNLSQWKFEGDLSGVNFQGTNLSGADLTGANLSRANLHGANLASANLSGANLRDANLHAAQLIDTKLRGAELDGADLTGSTFSLADLSGTSFECVRTFRTIFSYVDLSEVKGLETVIHKGPSDIGFGAIYLSSGNIPEVFLRGCGMPESLIVQIPALVAAMQPIQFYSCFISYSSRDQKFAERLYADLQSKGVRCWYAPHDLKIGEKIRVGIDESIRVHDKLLLILSKNSIESEWVEKEVETAMEKERRQKRTILFPIRLDDAVNKVEGGWAADVRRSRNIGDFRRWKSHDVYSKSFERLLRDLQASA